MTVWLRDSTEDGRLNRLVVALIYGGKTQPRDDNEARYAAVLGQGSVSPDDAARRPPYTAPGAPGFDSYYRPPRTYPDSLKMPLSSSWPLDSLGRFANGYPRGWKRKPKMPPPCEP